MLKIVLIVCAEIINIFVFIYFIYNNNKGQIIFLK